MKLTISDGQIADVCEWFSNKFIDFPDTFHTQSSFLLTSVYEV